ncbi:hypothetical protein WHR41_05939 [Cladosporium halotolerans]|uniref:RING-CH-type domain-containing protein n=1 Tax=Cladosporium halotolerans TaxID=1052096 RepID=A0AB34KL30_9PEZI
MASMPQRQPSNRRASPEHTSAEQPSPTTSQSPVLTRSANSEDSQVVILDHQPTETTSAPAKSGHRTPDEPDSQVQKCWICFSDANEDTPETSPWRDPCPCALVAHEECLLDWIADTEAPKNSRNRSFGAPQITCPQCKSEIKLARPKNYIVEVTRGLERLGGRLVWPTSLTLLSGLILQGNSAVGVHTLYRIFGRDDAYRILQPRMRHLIAPHLDLGLGARTLAATVLYNTAEALRHWRVTFGLQLITPLLILSRTTLADSVLPALPVLFLATQAHSENEVLDFTAWPPSASMAFAVLPYARSLYNFYFERVWAKKEQEWIREVQPRNGQDNGADGEQQPEDGAAAAQAEEGDNMFEVRIDGGIWEDWEGGRPAQEQEQEQEQEQVEAQQPNDAPAQEQNQDQEALAAAAPPPDVAENRAARPANPAAQPVAQQPQNNERRLSFSTTAVAETVLGALAFPTIAELSGELLRLALPTSWTIAKPTGNFLRPQASGLLQEKWGRSLVGGCLFVVVKDALMLYVRWRSAKMHRERRVLDYDRKKGKVLQA